MNHCTTREPDPFTGGIHEQEANEPDPATCEECSEPLDDEPHVVTVLGKAYCQGCGIDEICRLRVEEWGLLTEADHLDLLEELAEAADRERQKLVTRVMARKAGGR